MVIHTYLLIIHHYFVRSLFSFINITDKEPVTSSALDILALNKEIYPYVEYHTSHD